MKHRASVVVGAVLFALLSTFGMAGAAPTNAPSASTIVMPCTANEYGIDTVTVVVMDNSGSWSPGHIVAINGNPASGIGIPLEFQVTLTDSDGVVHESFDEVKPGTRTGVTDTLQCTETESFVDDQGTGFTVVNVITVFIAHHR